MKAKNKEVAKLLQKYKEIALLGKISSVLGWDLNVNLPTKASEGRAGQLAYLSGVLAEKWQEGEFIDLTQKLKNLKTKRKVIWIFLDSGTFQYIS